MTSNSPIAEENPQLAAWLKKASDIAAAYPVTTVPATIEPTAEPVTMPQLAICPMETTCALATRGKLDAFDIVCELRDVVDGLQEDYLDDYAAHVDPTLMYSVSVGMQPKMHRAQITTQLAYMRCIVVLDYSGELDTPQAGNFTAIKHHVEADFAHEPHDTYTALVIRSILDVWTNTAVRACV